VTNNDGHGILPIDDYLVPSGSPLRAGTRGGPAGALYYDVNLAIDYLDFAPPARKQPVTAAEGLYRLLPDSFSRT
jgi:hypothetical protein